MLCARPPIRSFASTSSTSRPASRSARDAAIPAAPAPITTTSAPGIAYAAISRFSPAMRIIAFCSFSNARTSICRTRSRDTL